MSCLWRGVACCWKRSATGSQAQRSTRTVVGVRGTVYVDTMLLICWGCWVVKRQRRVLAQFWRSDVQGSGATGLVSNKSSVHGLQMAAYSVSLVCVCGQGEKKVISFISTFTVVTHRTGSASLSLSVSWADCSIKGSLPENLPYPGITQLFNFLVISWILSFIS